MHTLVLLIMVAITSKDVAPPYEDTGAPAAEPADIVLNPVKPR